MVLKDKSQHGVVGCLSFYKDQQSHPRQQKTSSRSEKEIRVHKRTEVLNKYLIPLHVTPYTISQSHMVTQVHMYQQETANSIKSTRCLSTCAHQLHSPNFNFNFDISLTFTQLSTFPTFLPFSILPSEKLTFSIHQLYPTSTSTSQQVDNSTTLAIFA